jgi:copper chaperone
MTCGHCEEAVKREVGAVAGVADVVVDLDSKDVTITGTDLDRDAIAKAVDEAGFDVG